MLKARKHGKKLALIGKNRTLMALKLACFNKKCLNNFEYSGFMCIFAQI